MQFNSLKFKISVLASFLLAVILVVFSAFLFFSFRTVLYRELDDDLRAKARHVNNAVTSYLNVLGHDKRSFQFAVSRVVSHEGTHSHQNKIEKLEKLWVEQVAALGLGRDTVNFFNPLGRPMAHSGGPDAGPLPISSKDISAALKGHPHFKNVKFGKERLRVIISPVVYRSHRGGVIVVGTSRERVAHILRKIGITEIFLILVILAAASGLSQLFARRVLRPMEDIIRTTRHIHYRDLSVRIQAEDVDLEMKDLVDSLNEMMSRLETSFNYIAEFSSYVSHELKTPLAIMRGESEVALQRPFSSEEYQKVIKDNLDEVMRMTKIIDDLLLLTKLDYDPRVFKFEPLDLTAFLREIEEPTRLLAGEKDITVRLALPAAPLSIRGDGVHLRRLFFNLINNAIKFTPPRGEIGISMKRKGGSVFVAVSDTGVGIPQENLPKVFHKFFHFEGAAQGVPSGTGLGLSIAQSIARIHGGDIRVESAADKGSTFTVRFPLT